MTHIGDEIAAQPGAWRRAAKRSTRSGEVLPRPGERVAVVGCGTSWFMAEAYARRREDAGQGLTDFFTASELPPGRDYDRLVTISRSGTTTEIVDVLDSTRLPSVAITSVAGTPVATAADQALVLDFADERSVVQTLFATTTLMLLRASLGDPIEEAAAQAEAILAEPVTGALDAVGQITFLGHGWAHGIAREAALKMREAVQLWTESYPQMEYRHGPIAIAEPGRAVWVFGPPQPGILDDARATGATVIHSDDDPVADLVRVQRLAERLAQRRGLDPDRPRNLTRAVLLDGSTP